MGPWQNTWNKKKATLFNQRYLRIDFFALDDFEPMLKTTFWYTKYTMESPNFDFEKFLKLEF